MQIQEALARSYLARCTAATLKIAGGAIGAFALRTLDKTLGAKVVDEHQDARLLGQNGQDRVAAHTE